ncbi:MAG: NAD-dependent DNA ligase LigA, partial [Elusimicrobia bacterium]|nr:NAD-dependent DNA ligase LigA [Elusimicrobiota bacterium]
VYKDGVFKRGSTRGNGEKGEDISKNLKTIGAVPLKLRKTNSVPELLSVRGEVFMSKKGFQKVNRQRIKKGNEAFANPRNAAAGLMRQLDPKKCAGMPLNIVYYEVLAIQGNKFRTHHDELKRFPQWGLRVSDQNERCRKTDSMHDYYEKIRKNREKLDYEIDGVVIKVDDAGLREKLSVRERSPRWAIARKFPPRQEITTLQDIAVQVGRTGMLTPVGLLEPVEVGGVTISRATLHNEDEVNKKNIRPGDRVRIARAGDVIPEVVERVKKAGSKKRLKFRMPKKCPSCGGGIYKEGAYYFCARGLSCRAQLVGHLIHFASRNAMDISGLGSETVKEMVDRHMVRRLSDLFHLRPEDIRTCEGFAEKSSRTLYRSIQKAKKKRLDVFLYALGIRHVGEHVARIVAMHFKTLGRVRKAGQCELHSISEIGPEIAESISRFFSQDKNQDEITRLLKAGVTVTEMPAQKSTALKGKTFVFTGELEDFSRSQAQKEVELRGGRATSSVSANTDYVVAGKSPGKKRDEANKHDVAVIDENKFKKKLKSASTA